MDLSNYQLIAQEVRNMCRYLSPEDQEDLVQDVCVSLLASKATHITRKYVRARLRYILGGQRRKASRRPKVIYDSNLTEHVVDKGADNV